MSVKLKGIIEMKYMMIVFLLFINAILIASAAVTFAKQITEAEILRQKAAESEMLKREFGTNKAVTE